MLFIKFYKHLGKEVVNKDLSTIEQDGMIKNFI